MHNCQIPEWMTEARKGQEWDIILKNTLLIETFVREPWAAMLWGSPTSHTVRPYGEGEGLRLHTKRLQAESSAPGLTTPAPAKWISWSPKPELPSWTLYSDPEKPWKVMCCYFKPLLFHTEIIIKTLGKQLSDER